MEEVVTESTFYAQIKKFLKNYVIKYVCSYNRIEMTFIGRNINVGKRLIGWFRFW